MSSKALKLTITTALAFLGLVILFVLFLIGDEAYKSVSNPAKQNASVITDFVDSRGYEILHEYNRAESITVSSPSYEYYLQKNTDLEVAKEEFVRFMEQAGYQVEVRQVTHDPQCSIGSWHSICEEKGLDYSNKDFIAHSKNGGKPFWIAVGIKDNSKFKAEIVDTAFSANSNDHYFGEHNVPNGSVIAVTFRLAKGTP